MRTPLQKKLNQHNVNSWLYNLNNVKETSQGNLLPTKTLYVGTLTNVIKERIMGLGLRMQKGTRVQKSTSPLIFL